MAAYEFGYVLPVEGPLRAISARGEEWNMYRHKETGKLHHGWFHCGCCGDDGFASVNLPVCTGCANTLLHGEAYSTKTAQEIQNYCKWVADQNA